jgi:hypothetical protein
LHNKNYSNEPLHLKDAENLTFGCRKANPENCAKNSLRDICAFVREDNTCLAPPQSWRRKFKELEK